MIVPIISEAALEGVKRAHERQDNVLLEYEVALELLKAKQAVITPVHLGKQTMVKVNDTEALALLPFSAFNVTAFSEAKHAHQHSCFESVRTVMKGIFKLQGISADPRDITSLVQKLSPLITKMNGDDSESSEDSEQEDEYNEEDEDYRHPEHRHALHREVLQKSESWRTGWFCDVCGKDCGRKKMRYSCVEECDYDICDECMEEQDDDDAESSEPDEGPEQPTASPRRKLSMQSSASSFDGSRGVWLEKEGQGMGLLTGRKRRYFVLTGNQIKYFADEVDGLPADEKGHIPLCGDTVAEVRGKKILLKTPARGAVEARTWNLLAKSPKVAAQWAAHVWDAISQLSQDAS